MMDVHDTTWLGNSFLSDRFVKRTRVSVACNRCKARKSKCDGAHPSCSTCHAVNIQCQYPQTNRPPSKTQYIRALEDRVIELEKKLADLAKENHNGLSADPGSTSRPQSRAAVEEDDSVDSLATLIRDLSCGSGGVYVGASSNISMGRLMASVMRNAKGADITRQVDSRKEPASLSTFSTNVPDTAPIDLKTVPSDVATRLYHGYLQHISTRLPIVHTPFIAHLHLHKDSLSNIEEKVILHLIYANGGRYLETTGEIGNFFPERHFNAAIESLEEVVGWRSLRSVQVLLLLGVYSLRAPKVPGAWNYVGLAMRTCVELGMHRWRRSSSATINDELSNRVFWSGYMLDRQISLALGRPFAIPDHDIDAELPLAINEEDVELPFGDHQTLPVASSLACFRQTIHIRQIESQIKNTIYRLDRSAQNISDAVIGRFQIELEGWRNAIPPPSQVPVELGPRPYDGYDYYLHFYYNCLRQLYFPIVLSQRSRYVKECAEACIGVCETFKKLHRNSVVGYSLWALQTVFLAGLTLIYTIWINPSEIYSQRAIGALNDCNVVLYIIVERWPLAKKYRDAFEEIKDSVAMLVANGLNKQQPVLPWSSNAAARELIAEEPGFQDCERMIFDMTQQMSPECHQDVAGNDGFPADSGFGLNVGQLTDTPGMFRFDSDMLFDLSTGIDNFDAHEDISGA